MRFLRGCLPHISLAMNVVLLVVVYLDRRNPMMGFLMGAPFFVLTLLTAVSSIATSLVLYCWWRKKQKRKSKAEKRRLALEI